MLVIKVEKRFEINPGAAHVMKSYVRDRINTCFNDGVRAFVDEVLRKIKVDSGMTGASLLPLAGQVRHARFVTQAIASGKKKKGHQTLSAPFENNNGPFRSRRLGARLGRDAYSLKHLDGANWSGEFLFRIVVFQHFYHEATGNTASGRATSGNWRSLEAGMEAFKNTYRKQLKARLTEGYLMGLLLKATKSIKL